MLRTFTDTARDPVCGRCALEGPLVPSLPDCPAPRCRSGFQFGLRSRPALAGTRFLLRHRATAGTQFRGATRFCPGDAVPAAGLAPALPKGEPRIYRALTGGAAGVDRQTALFPARICRIRSQRYAARVAEGSPRRLDASPFLVTPEVPRACCPVHRGAGGLRPHFRRLISIRLRSTRICPVPGGPHRRGWFLVQDQCVRPVRDLSPHRTSPYPQKARAGR